MSKPKERPILFSGEMVRAILDGRKTQTRRVVKPQPPLAEWGVSKPWQTDAFEVNGRDYRCPYGQPGDRLWARETTALRAVSPKNWFDIYYPADEEIRKFDGWPVPSPYKVVNYTCLVPSTHMPRWASRIDLEVVNVRVERVQEISEEDVLAEGFDINNYYHDEHGTYELEWAVEAFSELWDTTNAKRGYGWDTNPWVWVVEFKVVKP